MAPMNEEIVRSALEAREAAHANFLASIKEARDAGATIQQLMDWTGYSRRTIFYLLKSTKPAD
jgi:hypothetical protein